MAHDGTSHPPIPQDSTPPPPNNAPEPVTISFQDHTYAMESPWVRPNR